MKKWYGNTKCDICGKECEHVLYDGATKMGPWAVMCEDCMEVYGIGIGMGKGQEYWKNPKTDSFEYARG